MILQKYPIYSLYKVNLPPRGWDYSYYKNKKRQFMSKNMQNCIYWCQFYCIITIYYLYNLNIYLHLLLLDMSIPIWLKKIYVLTNKDKMLNIYVWRNKDL